MLAPGGEDRSQMVRQPPSFLGTTPSPEQPVFGTGGEAYEPAMRLALYSLAIASEMMCRCVLAEGR